MALALRVGVWGAPLSASVLSDTLLTRVVRLVWVGASVSLPSAVVEAFLGRPRRGVAGFGSDTAVSIISSAMVDRSTAATEMAAVTGSAALWSDSTTSSD